ncbi:RNA-directed DNA polymerase, eukaryota, partial [Tanacetum coccineum]
MINVYGPRNLIAKVTLWNKIWNFMQCRMGKYVLFGDMNGVRDEHERYGSIFSRIEVETYNTFISNACLIDLPMGGRLSTWVNKAGTKLIVWENIAKKPKDEIDKVLRGPPDAKKQVFGKVDQALELQKLISEHIVNMHVESQNIIKQGAKPASGKENQVLQLQKVISEHITS